MSQIHRIAFAASVAWLSRAVSILSGLLLIPVLFRYLGKEELGVWLLLGQSWVAMGVLDLGLGPTLTRRIALAKGKSGADVTVLLSDATKGEIADLLSSGARLFIVLAVLTFGLSWTAGYFYLRQIPLVQVSWQNALIAWSILCFAQAVSLHATVWSNLLIGLGYVGWDLLVTSSISLLTIGFQVGVALSGGGIIGLAIVQAIGTALSRLVLVRLVKKYQPEVYGLRGQWNRQAVSSMAGPAIRCWLTTLGGVLVQQTDQLFIAQAKGAAEVPTYRAAYLICVNLTMIATAVAGSSAPFISQLWQAECRDQARDLITRGFRFGMCLLVCLLTAVLVGGRELFTVWLGPGHFAGYPLLILFSVIMVCEAHSFIASTASRATEDEAFAGWSIASGILKLICSYGLMRRFGILGLAAGTLVAQGLTVYWYMSYRALRRLQISFHDHLRDVLLPSIVVLLLTLAVSFLTRNAIGRFGDLGRLAAALFTCTIGVVFSFWFLVINSTQRKRLYASCTNWRRPLPTNGT